MVNTNIQATVPLLGRGLVNKPSGDFKPGEYTYLTNAEITVDGTLRGRRALRGLFASGGASFKNAWATADTSVFKDSDFRFIGEMGRYTIATCGPAQIAIYAGNSDIVYTIWSQTDLPADEWLVGAFLYNNNYYWITQDNLRNNSADKQIYVYSTPSSNNLTTLTFASLTKVAAFDPGNNSKVRNFFVHKDRLFIVTTNGMWFSKATDPTVWAVPDGGFVKLDAKVINHAFALGNSVYILSNQGIDLFTYSIDPNQDLQVRTIANNFRAITGCVHKSVPYVANGDGIYSLSNGYVEQVCAYSESYQNDIMRLVPMDDSLVVVQTDNTTPPFKGPIVFNLESQSLYSIWIPALYDETDTYVQGNANEIVDAFTPSWTSDTFAVLSKTYFMSNYAGSYTGGSWTRTQTLHQMVHNRSHESNIRGNDLIITLDGNMSMPIRYDIEIRDIQPDNNKFLKKKFRSLQILAKLPNDNFKLSIAIDGYYYNRVHPLRGTKIDPVVGLLVNDPVLIDSWGGEQYLRMPTEQDIQGPHVHRIPINQRGSSFSLKFEVENWEEWVEVDPAYEFDPFNGRYRGLLELIDIRYNWSYLGRPAHRRDNIANDA